MGVETVKVSKVGTDPSDFRKKYDPGNPAADKDGYVSLPNVNALVEMTDMREAQRSYEANLKVIEASRSMLTRTIDVLR
jgi:flagellar basal-body rod protein FlgC